MDDVLKAYESRLPGNILRDLKKEITARNLTSKQIEKVETRQQSRVK